MNANIKFSRNVIALAVVVVLTTIGMTPRAHADGRIIPVNANVYGDTYGDWSAIWWQWLLSIPANINPILDTTGKDCTQKQSGLPVFFLVGTQGGSATRSCNLPAGKALFFSIVNALFGAVAGDCEPSNPGIPCNLANLRVSAAAGMDSAKLTAIVDGEPLQNLHHQRVLSPVLTITVPADPLPPFQTGMFTPNVSDGYWLMLPPLPSGKHTVYFKGQVDSFTTEVTYHLTIGTGG